MSKVSELVIETFDPRTGEDFRLELEGKQIFSTKEHGWFAIDMFPKRRFWSKTHRLDGLVDLKSLLTAAIKQTGRLGFFSCDPLTRRARQVLTSKFDALNELCGSVVGYFAIETARIEEIVEQYVQLHSYEEWIIGSCKAQFQVPKEPPKWFGRTLLWNYDYLLLQADKIGCLFYFNGETGEVIILTRLFDGMDELVHSCLAGIRAAWH